MNKGKVSVSDYRHEIDQELENAYKKHGPFPDVKTGFGRKACEMKELEVEIMITGDLEKGRKEAIQDLAMGIKLIAKIDETLSKSR